jgi:DnaK suppressor protein
MQSTQSTPDRTQKASPLKPSQLEHYRSELQAARLRVRSNLDSLNDELATETGASAADDQPDVSRAAMAIELHDRDLRVVENEQRLLDEIDAALARIADETYGWCVRSGRPIPLDRLDAMPWADRCIEFEAAS